MAKDIRYFCFMESERQRKIGALLQRDLADILQKAAKDSGISGLLISVTEVAVTVDLMIAKVYLSFFPEEKGEELFEGIQSNAPLIRHELANRTRNQMRRVPELLFFKDETAKKAEDIERSLKGEENPIEDRSLLDRRQKK
ncbi:MAG: Ribosome-binding factor A [Flavobacteriaceae bacterium]|jgi:ribosome-binding factor A|nr:MAG: Ribosome-binding factor A [Flavobacteriaceae bacterium]